MKPTEVVSFLGHRTYFNLASVENSKSSCGDETEFSVRKSDFVPCLMQSGVILILLKEVPDMVYNCQATFSHSNSVLLQFLYEALS